jgi:SAM-dependent methyltransferase
MADNMKNYFGYELLPVSEIVKENMSKGSLTSRTVVIEMMTDLLTALKMKNPASNAMKIINLVALPAAEYEEKAYQIVRHCIPNISSGLDERAKIVYEQIRPHLKGTILDYGCGDCRIGLLARQEGYTVIFADVYRHANAPLDFIDLKEKTIPDKSVDTCLLVTVLHHAMNPKKIVEDAVRISKNGLVIIESVFDVSGHDAYCRLPPEQQMGVSAFFDHFGNVHFLVCAQINDINLTVILC